MGHSQLMDGKSLFMQWFRKEVRSISIGLLCHRPRHDEVLMAWKELQWVSLCKSCDSALSLENEHCRRMFRKCFIQKKKSKKVFINTFQLLLILMVLMGGKVLGDDERCFFSFTEMLREYVCPLLECKAINMKRLYILVCNLCKDRPGPMPKAMQTGQINWHSCFLCRYKDLSVGRFLQENGWLVTYLSHFLLLSIISATLIKVC